MRWPARRGATSDWGIQEAWDEGNYAGQGPAGGDAPVNPITEISQLVPWHA